MSFDTEEPGRGEASGIAPRDVIVTPEPTAGELAAIIAAYEALWPRNVDVAGPTPAPRWRWAGRPWVRRPTYRGWK